MVSNCYYYFECTVQCIDHGIIFAEDVLCQIEKEVLVEAESEED